MDNKIKHKIVGTKTQEFLKKKSRQAVEKYQDIDVLFFQIDYKRSKKNGYGELLIKQFIEPSGIPVKAAVAVESKDNTVLSSNLYYKDQAIRVSIYKEQLDELGVEISLGDCFGWKNRLYEVYQKTLEDSSEAAPLIDESPVGYLFLCKQIIDESIYPDSWRDSTSKGGLI